MKMGAYMRTCVPKYNFIYFRDARKNEIHRDSLTRSHGMPPVTNECRSTVAGGIGLRDWLPRKKLPILYGTSRNWRRQMYGNRASKTMCDMIYEHRTSLPYRLARVSQHTQMGQFSIAKILSAIRV